MSDLDADLEFLMRVAQKVETIREDLGKVGTVLAEEVEEAMLGRRTTLEHGEGREGGRADPQDAQVRAGLGRSRSRRCMRAVPGDPARNCGSRPRTSGKVVEVGLALADQPPLIPAKTDDGKPVLPAARL